MSSRGSLISNQKKPKLLSESKQYVPLTWLSFLSPSDFAESNGNNGFTINHRLLLERSAANIPFLVKVFKEFPTFEQGAAELTARINKLKCETMTIDLADFIAAEAELPGVRTVVGEIAACNENFRLKIPPRKVVNPATGDKILTAGFEYKSTRDLIWRVCWFDMHDLGDADSASLNEYFNGYVWP